MVIKRPSESASNVSDTSSAGRKTSYATITELFNTQSEISSHDDEISNIPGTILLDTPAYAPLEEFSMLNVLRHESPMFRLEPATSYEDLQKSKEPDEESLVPSEFQLSRSDPTMIETVDTTLTITLNETETTILFELNQKVEDARSEEGWLTIKENERYDELMEEGNVTRQKIDAESQTINAIVKNCMTQQSKCPRKNQKTYVNNWIMFDTHDSSEGQDDETILLRARLDPNTQLEEEVKTAQLFHIYHDCDFRDKVKVILRILASNTFETPQKIYKGLIKEEISNPDVKPTYKLQLLWTYTTDFVKNRIVSAVRWNPINPDLLAVGYGPPFKSISYDENGYLLIWCAKNPKDPENTFKFERPIACLDWSFDNPSWIAVGFYNGQVQVLDVSGQVLNVVKNSPTGTICYKPHWDIHWRHKQYDEEMIELLNCDYDDTKIYSTNQDGRILCYSMTKDFEVVELTRLHKVSQLGKEKAKKIPIFESSAALLLRKNPLEKDQFTVGSEEGYIFYFSEIYSKHDIGRFRAHNGPIYSLEFSPFFPEIFVTSGADWNINIWCDGITEPLITMRTKFSAVSAALWSPTNAAILATIVENQICIWNLTRKTYEPMSITVSPEKKFFHSLKFMPDGKQLLASDVDGNVFVYQLKGMPVANYDRRTTLFQILEQALVLKPNLLDQFRDRIYGIEN